MLPRGIVPHRRCSPWLALCVWLFTVHSISGNDLNGGLLRLQGEGSRIQMNGATLVTECSAGSSSVQYIYPTQLRGQPSDGDRIHAYLHRVPATCTSSAVREPCISMHPHYPKLWKCMYSNGASNVSVGPVWGSYEPERLQDSGEVMGLRTFIECPYPPYSSLVDLISIGALHEVEVRIFHNDIEVPFRGLSGGNLLHLDVLPPPSAPPHAPPFAPPTSPSPSPPPPLPPCPPPPSPCPPPPSPPPPDIVRIETFGASRRWSDGGYATACHGYRHGEASSPPREYSGATGDGRYTIQPPGQSPFDVYCDMGTDGGGWTLVDNDASTANCFSSRQAGANPDLTVTRGSYLPGYAWSGTPQLLCKSSHYNGNAGWLTLNALTADALEYPTQTTKSTTYSRAWSASILNGNSNQGMSAWIYSRDSRFGSVWIGSGAQSTCSCCYVGSQTGLGGYTQGGAETCSTWVR